MIHLTQFKLLCQLNIHVKPLQIEQFIWTVQSPAAEVGESISPGSKVALFLTILVMLLDDYSQGPITYSRNPAD